MLRKAASYRVANLSATSAASTDISSCCCCLPNKLFERFRCQKASLQACLTTAQKEHVRAQDPSLLFCKQLLHKNVMRQLLNNSFRLDCRCCCCCCTTETFCWRPLHVAAQHTVKPFSSHKPHAMTDKYVKSVTQEPKQLRCQ